MRNIFPETTIVRPAPLFGFEDRLLHKLAGVTNLFTSNHMQERFWPVHVRSLDFQEPARSALKNNFRQLMLAVPWKSCYKTMIQRLRHTSCMDQQITQWPKLPSLLTAKSSSTADTSIFRSESSSPLQLL